MCVFSMKENVKVVCWFTSICLIRLLIFTDDYKCIYLKTFWGWSSSALRRPCVVAAPHITKG